MAQEILRRKPPARPDDRVLMRVGYGYVPYQEYGDTYSPEKALRQGTLFPVLDIPWTEYVPKLDREAR